MSVTGALLAGRYRLVSVIATGGMGVVWKGWDERLERPVAIKQLRPAPGVPEAEAEVAKDRAMREARITGRLQHPHAVSVFDAVEHEGQPCLVMPFLDSTTLSAVLRDGPPLSLGRVARIGAEVASALAAAHRLGIVHRDVKPGNILITADGGAHISDFGISHAMGDATLTSTGLIHGTPAYLAPEVARGEAAAFPADVFSLGATLYAALEGAPPFGTDPNAIALLHKVAAGRIPPLARAGPLTAFLLEMLSSDPETRPTMNEVASVLADHTTYAEVEEESAAGPDGTPTGLPPPFLAPGGEATEALGPGPSGTDPAGPPTSEERPSALSSWFFPADRTSPTSAGQVKGAQAATGSPDLDARRSEQEPEHVSPVEPEPGHGSTAARRRPSRAVVLAGAALVAILVILAAGALLDDLGRDSSQVAGRAAAPTTSVAAPSPDAGALATPRVLPTPVPPAGTPSGTPSATTDPDPSTEPEPDPITDPEPEPEPLPEPAPAPAPETTPEPEPAEEPDPPPAPADRATELASAISGYYALMPGNTEEGWVRMTADYQTNHAGGFASYDSFWSDISDVTVSDVQATPPDGVVATLTYYFDDGRVAVERTAYRMVDEGGLLKIAASEVLSSRSG